MRFLIVVSHYPPLKKAGMERACQRLAEAIAKRGHQVTVITHHDATRPAVCTENGVRLFRVIKPLALGPLWGITYMQQINKWMRRLADQWDFCLCRKLYLHSVVANKVCRDLGKTSAHMTAIAGRMSDIRELRGHRMGESLVRHALAGDAYFALSREAEREILECGVAREKIYPYRNFVDADRFTPSQHHGNYLLFVGRLHEQKNLPLLISAFENVHASHPGVRLLIVGSGPDEQDVRACAAQSPAASAIEVRGWANDPSDLFRKATAVVTASNAEGLSNVLLEAIASGAPVVTTDVSGAREVLDPDDHAPATIGTGEYFRGRGGMIAPIGDGAALTRAMSDLLGSDSLRSVLASEARARALEAFSEEAVVPQFLRNAGEILARGRT